MRQSSHFTEAYSLLNIHIINSSQSEGGDNAGVNGEANLSNPDTLHPGVGPAGFKSYSPLVSPSYNHPYVTFGRGPASGPMSDGGGPDTMMTGPPEFSTMQLLKVMSRLGGEGAPYLGYFQLCKELGIRAVDGMVKGRVLDLRWTECVEAPQAPVPAQHGHQSSHTAVEYPPAPLLQEEDVDSDMVPVGEHELGPRVSSSYQATPSQKTPSLQPTPQQRHQPIHLGPTKYEDEDEGVGLLEVVGPKLVPMTPIMRYAMREVVSEYEDEQSVSEYASMLSDVVEEY